MPPVSGWRKLTVGKYQYNDIRGYGFTDFYGSSWGELSDRFLNGKTIAVIRSWYPTGGNCTEVIFSNYESLPERTLYLKREDKEAIALTYATGEGIKYIKYDVIYFTEDDVNKTMNIYIGTTPPLREKLREFFGLGGFSHAEQRDASQQCKLSNGVESKGNSSRRVRGIFKNFYWGKFTRRHHSLRRSTNSSIISNYTKLRNRSIYNVGQCSNKCGGWVSERGLRLFDYFKDFWQTSISIRHQCREFLHQCRHWKNHNGVLHSYVAYNRTSILGGAVC